MSRKKGPQTGSIAIRVPLAVKEHVQARAAKKGKTVQAYLLPLLKSYTADWPWAEVRQPEPAPAEADTEPAKE